MFLDEEIKGRKCSCFTCIKKLLEKHTKMEHFGMKKMLEALQKEYYIPNMKEKWRQFIVYCIPCVLSEKKKVKREGILRPIPKGDVP